MTSEISASSPTILTIATKGNSTTSKPSATSVMSTIPATTVKKSSSMISTTLSSSDSSYPSTTRIMARPSSLSITFPGL